MDDQNSVKLAAASAKLAWRDQAIIMGTEKVSPHARLLFALRPCCSVAKPDMGMVSRGRIIQVGAIFKWQFRTSLVVDHTSALRYAGCFPCGNELEESEHI